MFRTSRTKERARGEQTFPIKFQDPLLALTVWLFPYPTEEKKRKKTQTSQHLVSFPLRSSRSFVVSSLRLASTQRQNWSVLTPRRHQDSRIARQHIRRDIQSPSGDLWKSRVVEFFPPVVDSGHSLRRLRRREEGQFGRENKGGRGRNRTNRKSGVLDHLCANEDASRRKGGGSQVSFVFAELRREENG